MTNWSSQLNRVYGQNNTFKKFKMKKGSGTNMRNFIRLLFGGVNIDRNKKEDKKIFKQCLYEHLDKPKFVE